MLGGEPLDRRDVQVVVVIVRDQDDVDRRQILEREAGRRDPARAGERHGLARSDQLRIGQDVDAVELDQQGRVADPGHGRGAAIVENRRQIAGDRREVGRARR